MRSARNRACYQPSYTYHTASHAHVGYVFVTLGTVCPVCTGGKHREDPPVTPNASLHGANNFAPTGGDGEEDEDGAEATVGSHEPVVMPPRAMQRGMSIGSFMWSWGMQRESPKSTPGNSLHGGNAFSGTGIESDGGK